MPLWLGTYYCFIKWWPSYKEEDPFSEIDPHKHVEIGHFVAMCAIHDNALFGILFFLEKIAKFCGKKDKVVYKQYGIG